MLLKSVFLASITWIGLGSGAPQAREKYPGTPLRPILSDEEASQLTQEKYLDPWIPKEVILPETPNYIVSSNQSIQLAVNQAITDHLNQTTRQYILIEDGLYEETVFIPPASVPLTLYGSGKIALSQSAGMTVAAWIDQVNPNNSRYREEDPAYSIYSGCAKKSPTDAIGTRCTAVVWIKNPATQIVNITIQNFATPSEAAQAVALRSDSESIHLESVRLLGHQDTFYVASGKTFVNNSYVEGDTDYVFGEGVAVFRNCTFTTVTDRKKSGGVVFAPKTAALDKYGFLVEGGRFEGTVGASGVKLGRPWDSGVYVPGESPNGEILIRESWIGDAVNKTAPWGAGAGSGREYSGNADADRDLNDNNYNRLWEYNNEDYLY